MKAYDFLNKLGVQGRPQDSASMYKSARVLSDMAYLGIKAMRCAAPQSSTIGWNTMTQIAQGGVKFMFTMRHNRPYVQEISDLNLFNANNPGAIIYVEGPNEVNRVAVTWNGVTDPLKGPYPSAHAYQAQLNTDINFAPVVDFTGNGYMGGSCDKGNAHHYPRNGQLMSLDWDSKYVPAITAAYPAPKPVILSEIGFHTLTTDPKFPGTDETTQARLILNALCKVAQTAKIERAFIFQLYDDFADNGSMETHFGLFRHPDYSPKPAANAVRKLTQFLADVPGGSDPAYVTITKPATAAMSSVLLNWANGSNGAVVFPTAPIWNGATKTPVVPANITFTMSTTMPQTVKSFDWIDLVTGATGLVTGPDAALRSRSWTLGENPLALRFNP